MLIVIGLVIHSFSGPPGSLQLVPLTRIEYLVERTGGLKSESENSDGMAKPAGTISGGNGHYPGYSKNLPTTTGRSFSERPWMDTERVRPRWCGQDMSEMWDSGLGRTQSTFRPTSPQPVGRKRRVGDRLVSGPGIGMPASNERAL